jgi:glucan-binding YG repeat protein
MAKGWQTLNGFKYYFGTDGKQQTGWKTISGKTYYFWPSTAGKHYKGTMATGKQTIGGKTYNFGTDGVRR